MLLSPDVHDFFWSTGILWGRSAHVTKRLNRKLVSSWDLQQFQLQWCTISEECKSEFARHDKMNLRLRVWYWKCWLSCRMGRNVSWIAIRCFKMSPVGGSEYTICNSSSKMLCEIDRRVCNEPDPSSESPMLMTPDTVLSSMNNACLQLDAALCTSQEKVVVRALSPLVDLKYCSPRELAANLSQAGNLKATGNSDSKALRSGTLLIAASRTATWHSAVLRSIAFRGHGTSTVKNLLLTLLVLVLALSLSCTSQPYMTDRTRWLDQIILYIYNIVI